MNNSNETPASDALSEQYKDASNFNTRVQTIQNLSNQSTDFYRWVFSQIAKTPDCKVFEAGCGTGQFWQANLAEIPTTWEITLSDFSPGMLQTAQNNLSQSGRQFAFQVVDVQNIPFEDASFDILIANMMLYHVPDLQRAFAEIRRVLKADGMFYAATVSPTALAPLGKLASEARITIELSIDSFHLENGAELLSQWFSHVERALLENALTVTEAEPMLALTRSMLSQSQYDEAAFQRLRELTQQEIATHGPIHMHMDTGLFKATGRK